MKDVQPLNIKCTSPYFIKRGQIQKVVRERRINSPTANVSRQATRQATRQHSPDSFKDSSFRQQLKNQLEAIKQMDMKKVERQRKYIADIKLQHESTMNKIQQRQFLQKKAVYRQLKHICSKKCTNCPYRAKQSRKQISLIFSEEESIQSRLDDLLRDYERRREAGELNEQLQQKMRQEIQKLKRSLDVQASRRSIEIKREINQRSSTNLVGLMGKQPISLANSTNVSPQHEQKYQRSLKSQLTSSDFINCPKISRRQSLNMSNLSPHNSSFRCARRSQFNTDELKLRLNLLNCKRTEELKTLYKPSRKKNFNKIREEFQEFVEKQEQNRIEVVHEKQQQSSEGEKKSEKCLCISSNCQNHENKKVQEPIRSYYSVYKKKSVKKIEETEKEVVDRNQPTISLKHSLNQYFRRKQLPKQFDNFKSQFLQNEQKILNVNKNLDRIMQKQLKETEDMGWISNIIFNHKLQQTQEDPLLLTMSFNFEPNFVMPEEREQVIDSRQIMRSNYFADETKALKNILKHEEDLVQCSNMK